MKISTKQIYQMLSEKKTIYLKNSYEDAVIKLSPDGTFAKLKGGKEYQPVQPSEVVEGAILEGNQITEEAYKKY